MNTAENLVANGWEHRGNIGGTEVWVNTCQVLILDSVSRKVIFTCFVKNFPNQTKAGH